MSYTTSEKTVAQCSSCGEIHTVEIKNDEAVFILGVGLTNQCPCGEDGLEILHGELEP